MAKTLYIVVPCYNEQEVFPETKRRLCEKLAALIAENKVSDRSRVFFVNDGSKDTTWKLITEAFESEPLVCGMSLSRNRGHQNALLAGLLSAADHCDVTISIDADLQDDVNVFDEMIAKYEAGADVVYGVRSTRETDTAFKRNSAQVFYKVSAKMGAETIYNHADFRLMSRRAIEALREFKEVNLYLRGLVPLVGFKTDKVLYERSPRMAGVSKYPLKRMLALALDGITGFSIKPIRMVFWAGVIIGLTAFIAFIVGLVLYFCNVFATGTMAVVSALFWLGGIQLIGMGIVGEYVGKAYMETKQRPRFVISEIKVK